MARALAESAAITATDLNQAMVDYAAAQTTARNVTWRQADALALPFADGAFDAVVCQFGVMFFPDKRAGYREALRVLAPGGRFLFNVWDRIEDNEISRVLTDAVAALFPADPPRFLARTPHGYHDVALIRDELGQAGFARVEIETIENAPGALPRDPAIGFCQGSPLRSEIEAPSRRALERDGGSSLGCHPGESPVRSRLDQDPGFRRGDTGKMELPRTCAHRRACPQRTAASTSQRAIPMSFRRSSLRPMRYSVSRRAR